MLGWVMLNFARRKDHCAMNVLVLREFLVAALQVKELVVSNAVKLVEDDVHAAAFLDPMTYCNEHQAEVRLGIAFYSFSEVAQLLIDCLEVGIVEWVDVLVALDVLLEHS